MVCFEGIQRRTRWNAYRDRAPQRALFSTKAREARSFAQPRDENVLRAKRKGEPVSIVVNCTCGRKLKAKNALAGKRVKCPMCGKVINLPKQKEAPSSIRVMCQCGQTLQANATLAGKRVRCPACSQTTVMPHAHVTTPAAPDPLKTSPISSDPFDFGDWTDDPLGGETPFGGSSSGGQAADLNYAPSAAPVASLRTEEKPKTSRKKKAGIDADVLIMVTAILCILHVLWRMGSMYPIVGSMYGIVRAFASAEFFSFDALTLFVLLISVARMLVAGGILTAGIGLLAKQKWAPSVGTLAGSAHFVVLALSLILTIAMAVNFGSAHLGARMFITMIWHLVAQSAVPGLLIYVTQRDS